MDTKRSFEASRITKPIQLLAAWLSGLFVVNGSFLATAIQLTEPEWLRPLLVVAAVLNIPLFLGAIFLLQTKFRPEMQEDAYYSEYIGKRLGNTPRELTPQAVDSVRELTQRNYQTLKEMILQLDERQKKAFGVLAKPEAQSGLQSLSRVVNEILSEKPKGSTEGQPEIIFSDKKIALNVSLRKFHELARTLQRHNVPVHEVFGKGAGQPRNFSVAFGDGFSKTEMIAILKATIEVEDPNVAYAFPEGEEDYNRMALIGSYHTRKSVPGSQLLETMSSSGLDIDHIYTMIGRGNPNALL